MATTPRDEGGHARVRRWLRLEPPRLLRLSGTGWYVSWRACV